MASAAGAEDSKQLSFPLSELDCPLCLKLLYEPVTTSSCGHTFCRACLFQALNVKKFCPMCREPCSMDALSHSSNSLLCHLLEKWATQDYKERSEEATVERRQRKLRLPVFYSGNPVVPGSSFDLHVFEPRYRVLVNRAMATSRRFLMVPNETSDYGCVVLILRCAAHPDGRSLISTKAVSAARVHDPLEEEHGFGLISMEADELIEQRPAGVSEEDYQSAVNHLMSLVTPRIDQYCQQSVLSLQRLEAMQGPMPQAPGELTYWICRALVHSSASSEGLILDCLRSPSVAERLRLCINLLDEATTRVSGRAQLWEYRGIIMALLLFLLYKYGPFEYQR